MRVLLDTHALLWFVLGDAQSSSSARALIDDPANAKLVSPASFWEIAIKVSIDKLALHQTYEEFIDRGIYQNGFQILPIEPRHSAVLVAMPFHHKEPFDRRLIAQARVEGIPIMSADAALDPYGLTRLW